MITIEVNKAQLNKLNSSLKKLGDTVQNGMQSAFRDSAKLIEQESKDNFDRQGFLYGSAWKPLAPSTRKQRARLGFNPARPILIRTGALKNAVRTVKVSSREAIVRNTSRIAKYHQGPGSRTRLPERVILTATERSERAIRQVFENAIAKILMNL